MKRTRGRRTKLTIGVPSVRAPGPTGLRCLAAALGVAGIALSLSSPAGAVTASQIVSAINAERHANGLPPVREDPTLSAGCAAYDNYRRLNGSIQDGFTPGPEQASKQGYSAAGAHASQHSLLNAGDRPADDWANGDVFDDAPGHLFQLMNPELATIGADQTEVQLGSFFGAAFVSCVDTRSARYRPRPRRPHLYTYIGPNGSAPTEPSYREGPPLQGTLIFAYFDGPRRATVTLRSLRLQYPNGTVSRPAYSLLTGGLRDGRLRPRAHASRKTGKFSSPQPSIVVEVGPPVGEGPYKLKMVYEYQEPGHRLIYSTTVPFSTTVFGGR